jgi:hypothetical protein
MSQKPNQTETQDIAKFSANNLTLLSPFRLKRFEVTEKTVQRKDGSGSFISKNYILTISPQQNPSLECEVSVFAKDFDTMKTLAFLHGGFNHIWIKATRDDSKARAPNIYTAFEG